MTLGTAVLIGCVRAATGAMGVRGVRHATIHASASSTAKPAVLWLHGLGDTGAGWQGAFGPLAAAATFHHPTAPTAPVTINGGMQSTSWMDLKSFPVDLSEPEARPYCPLGCATLRIWSRQPMHRRSCSPVHERLLHPYGFA